MQLIPLATGQGPRKKATSHYCIASPLHVATYSICMGILFGYEYYSEALVDQKMMFIYITMFIETVELNG